MLGRCRPGVRLTAAMLAWPMLTDRGSEYCGNPERHEYELYLAVEDVDHTRTKTKSPQTNGICERFHKTVLNEFYRVAFRKKVYRAIDELQADLDLGSRNTMRRGHIKGAGASEKLRCRPSWTVRHCQLPRRR